MLAVAIGGGAAGAIAGWQPLLGFGAGDTSVHQVGLRPARLAEQEAAVRTIRGLLAGESLSLGWTAPSRLRDLRAALPRITSRLAKVVPRPIGSIPIMIGGGGEKVTLKLTAQHADMWNTFPPVDNWQRKNEILNDWCQKVGRDPKAVERTCSIGPDVFGQIDDLLRAGVQHLILRGPQPFDMKPLEDLLKLSGR